MFFRTFVGQTLADPDMNLTTKHNENYEMGVSKDSGFSPQIIHIFHRVFHYFHHPFWGYPYFWKNTQMKQPFSQIQFTENFLGMLKKNKFTQASSHSLRPSVLSLIREIRILAALSCNTLLIWGLFSGHLSAT